MCLIVGCYPTEDPLFCFAISGALSSRCDWQAGYTQHSVDALRVGKFKLPSGGKAGLLEILLKNMFACDCVCIQNENFMNKGVFFLLL